MPDSTGNFLYVMNGEDPAPAGDGDTRSWFEYYKWNAEGESFMPRDNPHLPVSPGDFLWFVLDGGLVGGVEVLRVETPSLPYQRQEIWYEAAKLLILQQPVEESDLIHAKANKGKIPEETGARWRTNAVKK